MSDYNVLFGIQHLDRISTSISIAFDTETLQLQPEVGKLRLLQLGCEATRTIIIIDCFELDEAEWERLRLMFQNGEKYWLAHNAVFDLGWLQEHGIFPRGRIGCSMLASKLLNNGLPNLKHGLAQVAKRYLKVDLDKEQQKSDWSAPVLSEEQMLYAAKDVEVLLQLDGQLDRLLMNAGLAGAYALECKALPAMAQMWRTGLPWNRLDLEQLRDDYEHDIDALGRDFLRELDEALPPEEKLPRENPSANRLAELRRRVTEMGHDDDTYQRWYAEIEELENEPPQFNTRAKAVGSVRLGTKKEAGFNLNSPKQLLHKFTVLLGKQPIDAKTGKPSAGKAALREYAADHHVVQTYLAWKKAEKRRQMVESILEKMDPDGFVRASYLQLGAETGRMSCWMPVVRKLYRGVEETIEVVTAEGGRLCCTSDHKLWTGSSWVKVADLSVGDTLGLFKEVGSAAGEHQSGVGRVSKRSASHGVSGCGDTELHVSQCGARAEGAANAGKTSGGKGSAAITRESRFVEPYEGQEWFPAPQLHRGVRGPEGLPDCARQQRKEGVSTSVCDGSGFGPRKAASASGSSSHRRGHTEQRSGQSGVSNLESAQSFTPSATQVESVKSVGSMGVWDIEVEGDHSYALYGFLSHNCIKPNNQNIPRDEEFRRCVQAPDGWMLVDADFGQMELRLAAAVAQDERMTKAFQAGEDPLEEAAKIREQWLSTYQGIKEWQQQNANDADRTQTPGKGNMPFIKIPETGMRRFLPGDMNRLTVRCNTPIQGAGAAILKCALGRLWSRVLEAGEDTVRIAGTVHDEILLLVREEVAQDWADQLKQVMEEAEAKWLGEIPPLAEVQVGKTWAETH